MIHLPVLTREVIEYLKPGKNENVVDCTIGEGGHSLEILKLNGPRGKILGIDWDPEQIEKAGKNLEQYQERLVLVNDNYAQLKNIIKRESFEQVSGVLLDLGMSSQHIEKGKGFSFRKDSPLDMRYSPEGTLTAEAVVNQWGEEEIARILKEYGEEKYARRIAKAVTEQRKIKPVKTTQELVEIIKRAVPGHYLRGRISFATRTFQALRIAVNNELKNLEDLLPQAHQILKKRGRMAVISFHSLEDRIVKQYFRNHSKDLNILTPKPVKASREEQKNNIRARSAKLRVAEKMSWQEQ